MHSTSLKILVCHYRDIYFRTNNPVYLEIQCGKDSTGLDLPMQGDNTKTNISSRNRYWSEITGLYWAWKNLPHTDYVGLCSYRRFFNFTQSPSAPVNLIERSEASQIENIDLSIVVKILEDYDIIVPQAYTYAYSIRRVCSMNYVDYDFDMLEKSIHEISPDYDAAYQKVLYGSNTMIGHNMFILPWDRFQEFCSWVFRILFRMEEQLDPSDYPVNQVRVFGYMHEILLGVYIEHHRLKQYHSQITWISEKQGKFKFNSVFYRIAASAYYYISRLFLGRQYQHVLNRPPVR
ncbi:DUF4422 domain-containing protein [Paracidovorax wautersii]|uniref:DUF4422 domain-containing protein n=1 Tax=Paracidovorax wautersii TaxID=1177982 RepID=A0A1I2CJZ3_9BURK|nr:DUF4422 domain-containing protein [Paracidovorax wautersii]SFE68621.1 protein of unknown function [Paracidovorax wautersii]